jgi:hypothetical protein
MWAGLHHHVGRAAAATACAGAVTVGAADATGAATAASPKATAAAATTEPILRDRTFTRTPPRMRAENHDDPLVDGCVTRITGRRRLGTQRVGAVDKKSAGERLSGFPASFIRVHPVE